jgi:hypothetical protein
MFRQLENMRETPSCSALCDLLSESEKNLGVAGVWNVQVHGSELAPLTVEATLFEEYLILRCIETRTYALWFDIDGDSPLPRQLRDFLCTVFTEKGREL